MRACTTVMPGLCSPLDQGVISLLQSSVLAAKVTWDAASQSYRVLLFQVIDCSSLLLLNYTTTFSTCNSISLPVFDINVHGALYPCLDCVTTTPAFFPLPFPTKSSSFSPVVTGAIVLGVLLVPFIAIIICAIKGVRMRARDPHVLAMQLQHERGLEYDDSDPFRERVRVVVAVPTKNETSFGNSPKKEAERRESSSSDDSYYERHPEQAIAAPAIPLQTNDTSILTHAPEQQTVHIPAQQLPLHPQMHNDDDDSNDSDSSYEKRRKMKELSGVKTRERRPRNRPQAQSAVKVITAHAISHAVPPHTAPPPLPPQDLKQSLPTPLPATASLSLSDTAIKQHTKVSTEQPTLSPPQQAVQSTLFKPHESSLQAREPPSLVVVHRRLRTDDSDGTDSSSYEADQYED